MSNKTSFFIAFIIEFILTTIIILSLLNTSFMTEFVNTSERLKLILLWTSLSVLFGWLIGIILQGKKMFNE